MSATTQETIPFSQETLANMIEKIMCQGATFQDAFQVSEKEMEGMYARGYELQKQRHFEKAQHVFEYLCYLNHYNESYWIALGFCHEQRKNYQKAIQAYVMAGILDADNPIPSLRTAECLLHMGKLSQAKEAAEMAMEVSGDDPRFKQRRERAEFLLKTIRKRRRNQEKK